MGAGFSIAPMVAALVAANMFKTSIPGLYSIFFAIGTAIGALNFVNLLPLLPLDGGRCLRQILITLSPRTGIYVILTISAGAAALSFVQESMSLITLVCLGGLVFFRPEPVISEKTPMSQSMACLALATYGFTLAAHATGGWFLIRWYFW
jgi:Zn-dependent protease